MAHIVITDKDAFPKAIFPIYSCQEPRRQKYSELCWTAFAASPCFSMNEVLEIKLHWVSAENQRIPQRAESATNLRRNPK
jgi:hypothetical protein